MSEETETSHVCFFSPLWNANPQTRRSLLSLVCKIVYSNVPITIRHCNFEFSLVWKHSVIFILRILMFRELLNCNHASGYSYRTSSVSNQKEEKKQVWDYKFTHLMQYRITILYGLEDMHLICFETIFQVHIDKRKSCIKCSIGLPFYYLTQNLCTLKIGLTYEQYFKFFFIGSWEPEIMLCTLKKIELFLTLANPKNGSTPLSTIHWPHKLQSITFRRAL